jgi:hypothetical protein
MPKAISESLSKAYLSQALRSKYDQRHNAHKKRLWRTHSQERAGDDLSQGDENGINTSY